MIGRNLGDLVVIEGALVARALSLKQRRRLPRGESVQDILDELQHLDALIAECKSNMRLFGGEAEDSEGDGPEPSFVGGGV